MLHTFSITLAFKYTRKTRGIRINTGPIIRFRIPFCPLFWLLVEPVSVSISSFICLAFLFFILNFNLFYAASCYTLSHLYVCFISCVLWCLVVLLIRLLFHLTCCDWICYCHVFFSVLFWKRMYFYLSILLERSRCSCARWYVQRDWIVYSVTMSILTRYQTYILNCSHIRL